MKLIVFVFIYALVSCDSNSGGQRSPGPPSNSPTPPSIEKPAPPKPTPEPDDEPKDKVLASYQPDFSPLKAKMFRLNQSKVPYVDDFFLYQQGLAIDWEETRRSGHIPNKWLSLWSHDAISYVDETEGLVKGIEKLEVARKEMLRKFPILSRPEVNAPVEVIWTSSETKMTGLYKATQIFLTEGAEYFPDLKYYPIFNGSLFPNLLHKIWIYGKNSLWDYPLQTVAERDGGLGVDETFIHEWGHHLAYAIDVNLGRSSYQTWQFAESWAETFRYVVFGSNLDNPEILDMSYQYLLTYLGGNHKQLRNPSAKPVMNSKYALRSMEECIIHEKYHGKFDPNEFLSALIEAYRRVEGRKLKPNPYPVIFEFNGGYAQAPWVGAGYTDNRRINKMQPLLVTRSEFLERFLEVYDCGLANEFIEADIEGMKKFEW